MSVFGELYADLQKLSDPESKKISVVFLKRKPVLMEKVIGLSGCRFHWSVQLPDSIIEGLEFPKY